MGVITGILLQDVVRHWQVLFLQPHCISTIPGGHVAHEPPGMGLRRS